MTQLLRRHLLGFGLEVLATFPIVVVQGARQVGKSTFAQMLVAQSDARILTLDDEPTRAAAAADPQAFVDQAGTGTLVIDEIQRSPELILAVKASVDRDRRPGRFVLTGSADLLRLERTPDSLAGRAVSVPLYGLSLGEQNEREEDFIGAVSRMADPALFATSWSRERYVAALARGGYPELRQLGGRVRSVWLDSYLDRIVQRDLLDLHGPTQPERMRAALRLIAANQAGELVKARIADQAGIPGSTVTGYIDALQTMFLISMVPPWTVNLTKREIGRAKALVTDSALAMRLDRVTEGQLVPLTGSDHLGGLLEGFVASELLKQSGWSGEEYRVFHFRDRNGIEVDLVIELADGRVFGLEVKASRTYKAEHFSGLAALAERVGPRFVRGIVLNTADRGFQYSSRLWGLPISALWEL